MGKEDILTNFVRFVVTLAKIAQFIEDDFFLDKFSRKFNQLTYHFFDFLLEERSGNVAQYSESKRACLADIDSILDIFKELEYLNLIKPSPLLLKAQTGLLSVKLEILRGVKRSQINQGKQETSEKKDAEISGISPAIGKKKEDVKLAESKKKLVDYIRSFPNSRTKDIIYEFNALSARSVKRNLTDLIKAGLVQKRVKNKAVYYYVNELQS